MAEFAGCCSELRGADAFAVDLETTSLNPREAEIVGISLSFREHEAYYIPVGAPLSRGAGAAFDVDEVLRGALRPLLTDPGRRVIGQNLKYDYQVFRRYGITMAGVWCDTMLASYLLNPARSSQGLDSLAAEFLDHRMISYAEVTGNGKEQNFAQVAVGTAAVYSCEDADATFLLHRLFSPGSRRRGWGRSSSTWRCRWYRSCRDGTGRGAAGPAAPGGDVGGLRGELADLEQEIYAWRRSRSISIPRNSWARCSSSG